VADMGCRSLEKSFEEYFERRTAFGRWCIDYDSRVFCDLDYDSRRFAWRKLLIRAVDDRHCAVAEVTQVLLEANEIMIVG
jgi:hypothetical protein